MHSLFKFNSPCPRRCKRTRSWTTSSALVRQLNSVWINLHSILLGGLSQTAKTQICFQLCMNVQIPKELGGVDGEALYIDTHGDFAVERITEMAKSLRQQVLKKIEKEQSQMPSLVKRYKEEFALDKILSKVRYVRILDEAQ